MTEFSSPDTSKNQTFPVPSEQLVLLDLDETILDTSYSITDVAIYDSIRLAQKEGWVLGLSSDRAYQGIAAWRERLGLNGPIIAERGAMVQHEGHILYTCDDEGYVDSRNKISEYLKSEGIVVVEGDPYHILRSKQLLAAPGEVVVVINTLREYSLGFYVRQAEEGGALSIKNDLTDNIADKARKLFPALTNPLEDINHDYGVIIVSNGEVTKRKGTQELLKIMQLGSCAIIGNAISDYVGSDLALHYAVADATKGFKEVADYIADAPATSGAVEVLKGMTNAV